MEMQDLVAGVRQHAINNYERDGWDYVIETMSAQDLAKIIGN